MFSFTISGRDDRSAARTGVFETPHGLLQTPELAIVATDGEIKAIPSDVHDRLPIKYAIVNTFHIFTKSILPKIETGGGIHQYAKFPDVTIASDSGGFQVFSLGFGKAHQVGKVGGFFPGTEHKNTDDNNPITIDETGVSFEFDGQPIRLDPRISMDIQHRIGADIIFAFDECTSPLNSKEYTAQALGRTHRWIHECITAHSAFQNKQALFAIVQGGYFEDLRKQSAEYMGKLDVPGFGIGGSLGKTKDDMYRILEWTIPFLPDTKPRHLLGIGQVRDIFEAVERGVDLFDCVIPTREARHRIIYTKQGKLTLRQSRATDALPDADCTCLACNHGMTLRKLTDLFTNRDMMAFYYTSVHNIQFFTTLMKEIREAIATQTFADLKAAYYRYY